MSGAAAARRIGAFHRLADLTEAAILAAADASPPSPAADAPPPSPPEVDVALPEVVEADGTSVTLVDALARRRTSREPADVPLERERLGWLLAHAARTTADLEVVFGRAWVRRARVAVVLSADLPAATAHHEDRGYRYALLEAGHLAQNLLLLAAAADLPACPLGGFADRALATLIGEVPDEVPLYAVVL